MKKLLKHRFVIGAFALALLLIIVGFVLINSYCRTESGRLRKYDFSGDALNTPQDGIILTVSTSKNWQDDTLHPDIPTGAQYDGELFNNAPYMFERWQAVLQFSEPVTVDSSWNGLFYTSNDELIFIADDIPDTTDDAACVKPHSSSTFGAILYSHELLTLKSYSISGYRLITPNDLPLYTILWAALMFWLIFGIMMLVVYLRTERYREQQKRDMEIIKQTMNTFAGFIDAKDPYTRGHSTRVAAYASEIAKRIKLDANKLQEIYFISLMHDCGKMGIPDAVLKKPGRLTEEEYEQIKSHTTLGDHILVNFTAIPAIRDGAHYHHERFDGKGYPSGLKGLEIPLCARIICVADSFDAMSSTRCYRKQLEKEEILAELRNNAGKQFDPDIVRIMIDMVNDGFVDTVKGM